MEPDPYHIETRESDTEDELALEGMIDLAAAPRLCEEARRLAGRGRNVAIDWQDAEQLGAGPLQVLLALGAALARDGRSLRVSRDNSALRRLLEVSGLAARFPGAET